MFKLTILVSILFTSGFAGRTFRTCPDGTAYPTSVLVTGCNDADPQCSWDNGSNAHVELTWTAATDIVLMDAHLTVTVNGLDSVYPINADACATTTPGCPITAGTVVTYTLDTVVQSADLNVPLVLTLLLHDQNEVGVVCVQLDAIVPQ